MHILGISGSPHPHGNTAHAVRYALDYLQREGFTTRYISLAGQDIRPCLGCFRCAQTRACILDDDMPPILEALRWCHGLILGSPVYMGLVSGQLKVMMDRCVPLRPSYAAPLELAGKVGAGIACGGFRNGGQETTLQNIQTFLLQQNMLAINDGAGFSHAGGTLAGEAPADALGLQTVENLARNMAQVLRRTVAVRPLFREIRPGDLPTLFAVRTATHENRLTEAELTGMGITPAAVAEKLAGTCKGWLCEVDGRVVGFAIGDRATGELWVIAVLPDYLGLGLGGRLLTAVEDWLRAGGCTRLWLTTDVDPRLKAYGFYRHHGWVDDRIEAGNRYMVKEGPPLQA